MATIGWIDFSTNDRNRVGSVLDLLRPEGMVDELGMGTVRDALANQLFPGISTIQTRAKYFFIIPYILYDYQATKPTQRRGKTPSKFLEDKEYDIMWALAEQYEYKEGNGVIGISKRKPNKIVRRPSAIYWNGLYYYQFINTKGLAADTFLRESVKLSTMETLLSSVQKGDDTTGDDADAEHENLFKIKVPPKLDWSDSLTLDLDKEEAEFFKDRILSIAKGKLIAELLQQDKLWELFSLDDNNFMKFANVSFSISENLKAMLILAHDFSELMYGAHLAYNCQLHDKVFKSDYFDEQFQNWIDGIKDKMLDYSNFNPDMLFTYAATTKSSTVQFIKDWWKLTQNGCKDIKKRDLLIEQQEALVKGSKARLRWKKTDDVKENKWLGLKHFDYRFFQARTILNDIKTGINK